MNGAWSFALGGQGNRADGDYSTIAGGRDAWAVKRGQAAHAAGMLARVGDAQWSRFVASRTITQLASAELLLGGDGGERIALPAQMVATFEALAVATRADSWTQTYSVRAWGTLRRFTTQTTVLAVTYQQLWSDNVAFGFAIASAGGTAGEITLTGTQRNTHQVVWSCALHWVQVGVTTV